MTQVHITSIYFDLSSFLYQLLFFLTCVVSLAPTFVRFVALYSYSMYTVWVKDSVGQGHCGSRTVWVKVKDCLVRLSHNCLHPSFVNKDLIMLSCRLDYVVDREDNSTLLEMVSCLYVTLEYTLEAHSSVEATCMRLFS